MEIPKFNPNLSWSHYRALMRISRPEARQFYEIETVKNRWSVRQMERQINSLLFDRLAKSKDKAGLLKLTIGLVLCTEKSDGMANYLLGDKAKQIFTSKYQLYLPTEEELVAELNRELKMLKRKKAMQGR